MKIFYQYLKDQNGTTAIEYGVILLSIALVLIVAIKAIGTNVSNTFATVNQDFSAR